jgi:hypothetical protein
MDGIQFQCGTVLFSSQTLPDKFRIPVGTTVSYAKGYTGQIMKMTIHIHWHCQNLFQGGSTKKICFQTCLHNPNIYKPVKKIKANFVYKLLNAFLFK